MFKNKKKMADCAESWADSREEEEEEEEEEEHAVPEEELPAGPIRFKAPSEPFGELSNFWPMDTQIPGPDGLMCRTVEHAFWVYKYTYDGMNSKTRLLREYINGSTTPLKARYYANGIPRYMTQKGKYVKPWMHTINNVRRMVFRDEKDSPAAAPRADWEDENTQIVVMRTVVNAKYTVSDRARTVLFSTGARELVADLGPYDRKWGCGPDAGAAAEGVRLGGLNLLGMLTSAWRDSHLPRDG